MNSTATRSATPNNSLERFVSATFESETRDVTRPQTRGRMRGRALVHGLPVQLAYAAIDAVWVCAIGTAVTLLWFDINLPYWRHQFLDQRVGHAYEGFFILYAALVVMGCASQDLYRTPRDRTVLDESLKVARAVGLATMILVAFIFTSGYKDISRLVVVSSFLLNILLLSGWRYLKRQLILRRSASGIGTSRVLIVGTNSMGTALGKLLSSHRQLGFAVCGYLDVRGSSGLNVLGGFEDFRRVALTEFVDEVFITPPVEAHVVKKLALEARELRIGFKIFPDIYDGLGWRAPLHMIGGFPVMDLHWQPIHTIGLGIKRLLDIVVAGIALLVSAPFLALLAVYIRMDSPGPVIYASDRIGLKGKRFRCYKLRTMIADAELRKRELRACNERIGPFFKMKHDPRITRVGKMLRKFSLDEIPQLWNVLRGDMSLVGPRPHPIDDYELYSADHLRRLDVSPGLTGLWQVTSRSDPSFEANVALDLEYIENWSLGLDLKILLRTIPAIMRGEGA
jgi:exopolysaccharide biosynthesis polyprenyl glycosylphosphotransferase